MASGQSNNMSPDPLYELSLMAVVDRLDCKVTTLKRISKLPELPDNLLIDVYELVSSFARYRWRVLKKEKWKIHEARQRWQRNMQRQRAEAASKSIRESAVSHTGTHTHIHTNTDTYLAALVCVRAPIIAALLRHFCASIVKLIRSRTVQIVWQYLILFCLQLADMHLL